MAEVIYQDPVKEIRGALTKHGTINRRKIYRDAMGRVIHEGTSEAYRVCNPRDWKKNPPLGEELKKINRFREACRLTKEIMQAARPDYADDDDAASSGSTVTDEVREQYNAYRLRYQKQLGRKPDPQAPLDPKTGRPKHYYRLDNFIRAIIYRHLKSQA